MTVVIPYRFLDPWRERLIKRVLAEWKRRLPSAQVVLGSPGDGLFNRAAAINDGVSRSVGDMLVIADADVLVSPAGVAAALEAGRWGFPFDVYYTMTEGWTSAYLAGTSDPVELDVEPAERDVVHRHPGSIAAPCESGCLVISRSEFDAAGGFDPGFVGWGYEDRAFVGVMRRLAGEPGRAKANALHLWHPVPAGHDPNSIEVTANRDRYRQLQRSGFPAP